MKKGFTIMELLVAISLGSCLLIFIALFSQSVFSVFSQINSTKVINDTMTLTRMTLSSVDQCTLNFQSTPLDLAIPQGIAVPSISIYNLAAKTAASLITKQDQNIDGVTIQAIRLVPLKQLEPGLMYSELRFTFKLPGSEKPAQSKRSLPVTVRLTAGKVTRCWMRTDYNRMVADQICSSVSGGALNSYNNETGACALVSGKWFKGSPYSASCPAGTLLSPSAIADQNCSYTMPSSYVDPTSAEFTFSDGTTNTLWRDPALVTLDNASATCHCDWGTDIDAASIAASQCEILCISP